MYPDPIDLMKIEIVHIMYVEYNEERLYNNYYIYDYYVYDCYNNYYIINYIINSI